MQDEGVSNDEYQEELGSIHNACQTCKLYTKTPARPVISMPLASSFNEKFAMDLKSWKGKYILHLMDMFTRLSVSVFTHNKTPRELVENVLQDWIGAGWELWKVFLLTTVVNSAMKRFVKCEAYLISRFPPLLEKVHEIMVYVKETIKLLTECQKF